MLKKNVEKKQGDNKNKIYNLPVTTRRKFK